MRLDLPQNRQRSIERAVAITFIQIALRDRSPVFAHRNGTPLHLSRLYEVSLSTAFR
jgi:hypothetical protein